ncbi:MAG: hypothetical protein OEV79_11135 [candidate division WOR-3 bacterium]|nr:hypothetical protein [candidate division WOR-3 bacterium]
MSPHSHTPKPAMQAPPSGVTVRMYNPGFGDCLLLAFRAQDGNAHYMLIDCGVHHFYPENAQRMQKVANDIAKATGYHLHTVAITHEHTDHLYGFKYAREIFKKIEIDDLWLAWTEDSADPVAKELKRQFGLRMRALTSVVNRLAMANEPLAAMLQRMSDYESPNMLASSTGGNAAQLKFLREQSKNPPVRTEDYLQPGMEPLRLPGVPGIRIYVLGPPKDVEMIKKLQKKSELYPELTDIDEYSAFAVAALAATGIDSLEDEDEQLFNRSHPFDEMLEITLDLVRKPKHKRTDYGQFFQKHYGFLNRKGHGQEWRRIDTAWLDTVEQLALSIHTRTNNTSLVLAIELTETEPRKVLLFAADAQVGNWLTWLEVPCPSEDQDGETLKGEDLIRRTVLYKVGHHGSRNATLSVKGLETMDSPELVAMIPVDQKWAKERMGWEHPAEHLLDRLKEKARGRVMRTDDIPIKTKLPKKPTEATKKEWKAFSKQLAWDHSADRLWVQYTVPG